VRIQVFLTEHVEHQVVPGEKMLSFRLLLGDGQVFWLRERGEVAHSALGTLVEVAHSALGASIKDGVGGRRGSLARAERVLACVAPLVVRHALHRNLLDPGEAAGAASGASAEEG
jgi:hypothetical protein